MDPQSGRHGAPYRIGGGYPARPPWRYSPHRAQLRAGQNAARPKPSKLAVNTRLRGEVQARLETKHSPEQIARTKGNYKESYAFREKIDTDGFDHPLKMFDLTEELIRRNYSDANIKAILGGNFRRLLGSTWL